MSIALIAAVGGLTAVGIYLITSRVLSRIIFGFTVLGHAAVLALLTSGGRAGEAPIAGSTDPENLTNPLPQALALTAIVISFGLTLFLLALAVRQRVLTGDDLVEDDLLDKRIADAVDEKGPVTGIDDDADAATVDEIDATMNPGAPEDAGTVTP